MMVEPNDPDEPYTKEGREAMVSRVLRGEYAGLCRHEDEYGYCETVTLLEQKAQALTAEVKRLRGALERIIGMSPEESNACACCGRPTGIGAITACARTALEDV